MSKTKKPRPATPRTIEMPGSREDETPVTLTEDQEAVYGKSFGEITSVLGWLRDLRKDGRLTVSTRATSMSCLEMYVADLGKSLGYGTDIEARRKADAANLRAANKTIRELESQIGAAFPPDALKQRVDLIHQHIDRTWRGMGFCLTKTVLGRCMVEVEFTVMIDSHSSTFSERPVSEKAEQRSRVQQMADSGLVLDSCRSNGDPAVLDVPASRAWIVDRLRAVFPSLKPFQWECLTMGGNGDKQQIRHLKAFIEYADLNEIPVPIQDGDE